MTGQHRADTVETDGGRDWKRRVILGAVALVALIAGYFILAAFIPRWWSQRIGQAVDGNLSIGALLGICLGLVFTIVPLALLYIVLRRPMSWKARLLWLVLALLLAAPNLMTLGVAVGTGSGSHAGQRTMDVDAPMFRGATLIGVLIAVAVLIVLIVVYRRRGPRRPRTS